MKAVGKFMAAGTRVRVREAGAVPHWSTWDDDRQRTSNSVKKRLQEMFFGGDRKILGQILFVSSESTRDLLRKKNQVKVEIRNAAGQRLIITADANNLEAA